ncbi:MAG: hypothetical protein JXL80_05930 [Planctomycetes bacterium]|nr:hypothetical protein [Planctomycetota bacterium]
MRRHGISSSAILLAAILALGGCAKKQPDVRLTMATGHTSRIVRDTETITLPIYEQEANGFKPDDLTFRTVTVRERHSAAQPARWSVTAAGTGPRGPTIGLVVTLPPEASSPLLIEADLDYNDRPQKLTATLTRTSVGSRRVWLLAGGAIRPIDR